MGNSNPSEADVKRMEKWKDVEGLIRALKAALKDKRKGLNEDTVRIALKKIGKLAVEPLIKALKDENLDVRLEAIILLGTMKDVRAVKPLIQLINDEDSDIQKNVVWALAKIGEPSGEPLIKALEDGNWRVRWGTARALGEMKNKEAVELLEKTLNDENSEVRMAAAISLEKIKKEREIKFQDQKALKKETYMNPFERMELIEKIIKNISNDYYVEHLIEANLRADFRRFNPIEYKRIMEKIREYPHMSLWDYKSPADLFNDLMEELLEYMYDRDRDVSTAAMYIFWSAQSKGVYIEPHIRQGARKAIAYILAFSKPSDIYSDKVFLEIPIEAAGQKDDDVRREIAFEIEGIDEQYFSDVFVEELRNSPNEWVREFSAKMLRHQRIEKEEEYDRVINALIEALKDPSPRVRRMVAETMGDFYEELDFEDLPEPEEIPYIDPLIAALGDEDQSVREEVLKALGTLGVKQSSVGKLTETLIAQMETETGREVKPLEQFLKILDSNKHYIRRLAILCLGYLGEKAVVEKLKGFLKDEDCIVREAAVLALGFYTSEQVGETLESALNDPVASVRRAAVKSLYKVEGNKTVETLIRTLDDENYWVRMRAVEALGEIRSEAAVVGLLKALKDCDYNIRQTASKHLIDINEFYVIIGLIETLKGQSYEAREQAAIVLGYIGDEISVKPLLKLIGDKENMVANAALRSLLQVNIRIPEGFKQAISDIDDDSIFESLTMHSARTAKSGFILLGIPSMDIVRLCELLDDPRCLPALLHQYDTSKHADPLIDSQVGWEAGKIIDKLSGNVSVETLLELLLKGYGAKAKGKIIRMLGEKRDPQIIKPIFYKLGDEDETIRDAAKQSLMNFENQISNILIEALDSPNPYLRESAMDMLGKMGDKRAIKAAFEALNDNKNKNIRDKGIETLGRLQEGSAVEYLLNALKQGDAKAAEALRNIGRKKILENSPENIDGIPPLVYIKNLAENPRITEIQGNSKVTKHFSNDFKKEIEKLLREIENKQPSEP